MKKILCACAVVAAIFAGVTAVGFAVEPSSAIQPITAESSCPVASCASGACHGFGAVPEPDGVHEMVCPEAGCAATECHAWDSLTGRYHQASDMSLNAWILMPTVLVLALWLMVRRTGRGGRDHAGTELDHGEVCHEA